MAVLDDDPCVALLGEVDPRFGDCLKMKARGHLVTSESEHADEWTIVAVGRDRRAALAALIEQLSLAIMPRSFDQSSRSMVARAEGATFEEMARSLCAALLDLVASEGVVEGITFDGMVQTDEGYAGWGHVRLGVGDTVVNAPALHALTATSDAGGVTLTALFRTLNA